MGLLKPLTRYVCPEREPGEMGHTSIRTGSMGRSLGTACACGAELVEEVDDGTRWRVSFEMVSAVTHPELYDPATERARADVVLGDIDEDWWHPVSRETSSEVDARSQILGLYEQIGEGELIRRVLLERSSPAWEPVS